MSSSKISSENTKSKEQLNQMAIAAMDFAHSPYSKVKIGSSVVLSNGKVYTGCNIENASYGGTVCAERVAIWKAFSENKTTEKIVEVVVASNSPSPWPPCGFCRQVMSEFCTPETIVRLVNLENKEVVYSFKNLFPEAFEPAHLNK